MILRTVAQLRTDLKLQSHGSRKRSIQIATYATTNTNSIINVGTSPAGTSLPSPFRIPKFPITQPPSHKPPEFRKSQLLRQYASLLRSSPLILIFQHNNIKANEWLALRRELTRALRIVDRNITVAAAKQVTMESSSSKGDLSGSNINNSNSLKHTEALAPLIKIQTVQTGIFAAALRVVDRFKIDSTVTDQKKKGDESSLASSSSTNSSGFKFTHTLSKAANRVAAKDKSLHELSPLLSGPICILYFPKVSPQHLKEAISILSPTPPGFPAPKKKFNPGWFDPAVQEAVQKLVLLGARIERKAFDIEGIKMVGSIEGGLQGIQSQLLALLQNISITLTNTLESASKNLYYTLESRRYQLNENIDHQSISSGDK